VRKALGNASNQLSLLLLLAERRDNDETRVAGPRDFKEFFVCDTLRHDRLNIIPE
jgi:hypothetical protein